MGLTPCGNDLRLRRSLLRGCSRRAGDIRPYGIFARRRRISCRKAYRSEAISCPAGANWASDAARYVCRTQTRYTAAARQYDMLPFASTICGLCRATIPPFIHPLHKGGMGEHASKSLPLRGEGGHGDARRACNGTAVTKRSGVEFRLHRMRWTRRKAERFSRMNCACGAWRKG